MFAISTTTISTMPRIEYSLCSGPDTNHPPAPKMKIPTLPTRPLSTLAAVATALAVTLFAPRLLAGPAIDPDADRIFHASCDYLAAAKGFCVNVEVWKDVVLPVGTKIQTTRTLEVQEQRPDQLHIEVHSPRDSRGFWYQHLTLTMLDRRMNLYGVLAVPGNIDQTLDAVEDGFGVEIPLGDLLVSDPYRNMLDHMDTAEDYGKVTVLGVVCNHLGFTGANADCQLWIADGPKPLPRKCVINFKTQPGSPQVTQIFSDWDLVSPISASVFTFVPPDDAGKITVNPKAASDDADDSPAPPAAPSAADATKP